jgi:hypothetical protein
MIPEPQHRAYGTPISLWIARTPSTLNDLPVGLWEIVNNGRSGFGLEGEVLADFVRCSIYALIDAGAKPVVGGNKPDRWELQVQYGVNRHEVAEAVIAEWLQQGGRTPEPWTGVWFGLPWSYLPKKDG